LYGNYVTLANISAADLQRIVEQRLSPLYISVHATDNRLREKLLGTKGIRPIMEVMEQLAAAGITMHTQIVLCPGLNDGAALERTVRDMASLYPRVASLAIVPVGLTRHRHRLPHLQPVNDEYAREFLEVWQPRCGGLADQLGEPFLFLADEFYIKAGMPFPSLAQYGDLPQVENGVGMIPLFLREAEETLRTVRRIATPPEATIVTGESPYPFLRDYVERLAARTGAVLHLVAVPNLLFGESVTVTGLVTGADIIAALRGRQVGDAVIVPDVMLKEGAGVFLDDLSVAGLQDALGVTVLVADATPAGLYRSVREAGRRRKS
jgi:putative radical SAM enzyme (TIGR03279 family)